MNQPPGARRPILVVGATGRIGSELIRRLLAAGHAVRALVRPDARTADGLADAAEIVPGDLRDRRSLDAATRGIAGAFVAVRDHPDQVEWESNLITSLEARDPVPLIKVSAFAASLSPAPGYGRIHAAIEARLRGSRLPWTVLQPYMYMQNFLEMAAAVRHLGRLALPLAGSRVAFIDARDVARAAASLFAAGGHAGQTYVLTGADSLCGDDVARAMSVVLERRVAYWPLPGWLAGRLMRWSGTSAWDVAMRAELFQMLRENGEAEANDVLARLAGAEPTSLATFLQDHRPAFSRPGG